MSDSKLGFTFYPKDWWTSDTFYALNPFERYIYLELLFMMYANDGCVANNKVNAERRLGTTIKDDVWVKITDLMVKDGDQLTHKSVNKRLRKSITNRENGKLGGRPKKSETLKNEKNNDSEKPKKPKIKTQNNPPYEREYKEKENRSKKEDELKDVFVFPFTESFNIEWNKWKEYKKREFKFAYKSPQSEQAAVNHLHKLSIGKENTAKEIIEQSIRSGWKGFFELKANHSKRIEVESNTTKMVM